MAECTQLELVAPLVTLHFLPLYQAVYQSSDLSRRYTSFWEENTDAEYSNMMGRGRGSLRKRRGPHVKPHRLANLRFSQITTMKQLRGGPWVLRLKAFFTVYKLIEKLRAPPASCTVGFETTSTASQPQIFRSFRLFRRSTGDPRPQPHRGLS